MMFWYLMLSRVGKTALHLAVDKNCEDVVDVLLEKGVNVDAVDMVSL